MDFNSNQKNASNLEVRLEAALNRLKPHFVHNAFTSIYYLCDMDTEQAKDITLTLSAYTLGALRLIENGEPVAFTQEFELVQNYLKLEDLRLGEKLDVETDITFDDFNIPALTLQAVVELAVKRSIAAKTNGGTLTIETERLQDGGVLIKVSEDGIGFEDEAIQDSHAELLTVQSRIRDEAGGDVKIYNRPGNGSTVEITLPASSV